ncbi:hypothetical protein [Bradyrhizobium tunisiense]|uniref:hypothetical protein n=1 Tax=Bradyrhizobium tunisiense TaxID=3278709 RepID=UPI0035D91F8A
MKADNFTKNGISNVSGLFAILALDLHSTSLRVEWMKPVRARGRSRRICSGESGRPNETAEMTWFVDLSEGLSARAKARVVPIILPGQRCSPFARAPATVMFAVYEVPSINSVRTELLRIIRPIVIGDS